MRLYHHKDNYIFLSTKTLTKKVQLFLKNIQKMQKTLFAPFYRWLLSGVDEAGNFYNTRILSLLFFAEIPIFIIAVFKFRLGALWVIYLLKFVIGYSLCFLLLGLSRKFLKNPIFRYGILMAFAEFYMLILLWDNIPEQLRENVDLVHKIEFLLDLIYTAHSHFLGFWCRLFPFFVAWVLAAYAEIEARKIRNPDKDHSLLDDL